MSNVTKLPLPFTVVLMRDFALSELMQNDDPLTDTYVANVRATGYAEAIKAAKDQVLEADQRDMGRGDMKEGRMTLDRLGIDRDDYQFLLLFEGHIEPKLHGWQETP